jgi:hypothetical protein
MLIVVVLALAAALSAPQVQSFDVSKATVSAPKVVAEIDAGKLKGNLVRFAWSDDGRFFVRSAELDIYQNERGRNFVIAPGGAIQQVDEEPSWAAVYWNWKAGLLAPGAPDVRLEVETREQNKTATGSTGQDFGGSGGTTPNPNRSDPTSNQISKDVNSMQRVVTTTVRFKGQVIAEVQNNRMSPGASFSWAPAPRTAVAFVGPRKRLVIVDREGRKLEVPGTEEVLLPAWSPDGSKIAYLQKVAKKKYALTVVEIG